MSENSKIEWTDHTFNSWEGCQKVSPGCDHCYAEARNARFAGGSAINWGPGAPRRRTSAANWRKPLQWNANHASFFAEHGRRQRVFCASLADVFDNDVDPKWRIDLFDLIELTPNLDWLLLTKRIGNVMRMLKSHDWCAGQWNVWLGATFVDRDEMLRDAGKLLAVPARVRFWSVEPMLGDLGEIPLNLMPDWVICGGESGPNARPMSIQWARSLRDQCAAAGVPFLFKQWGEWAPAGMHPSETPGRFAFGDYEHEPSRFIQTDRYPRAFTRFGARCVLERVGKKAAGRQLDGRTHDEFPRGAA
ncbi:phage Gp37/Gp68 family protein [Paraburkholderia xenovorans LB400]|uniref:Phage protein Gp37Gp68 n=1 Tax=Paraburkholderia xenovorans (strain LB400) TaxID=266265 RepID=Q141W6_PARXL|nr:phage Gp37/Gp68 family protein [Paraburkholderia xenovorans]ABE29873.1 Putative phage protein Gp37Gp68 [Paraburkholderia xenovorans LB400]AIP31308.1 phage Gp37/Gp68 family protein [Paraburkholderia xenovorans LB400]